MRNVASLQGCDRTSMHCAPRPNSPCHTTAATTLGMPPYPVFRSKLEIANRSEFRKKRIARSTGDSPPSSTSIALVCLAEQLPCGNGLRHRSGQTAHLGVVPLLGGPFSVAQGAGHFRRPLSPRRLREAVPNTHTHTQPHARSQEEACVKPVTRFARAPKDLGPMIRLLPVATWTTAQNEGHVSRQT